MVSRDQRHTGFFHDGLGGRLGPHGFNRSRRRADKHDPGSGAGARKSGVFRQETVTGMNSLGAGHFAGFDNPSGVQVGFPWRRRANVHCLVGHRNVQRVAIGIRVDRYRRNSQAAGRANDPAGDFTAICDQDFC